MGYPSPIESGGVMRYQAIIILAIFAIAGALFGQGMGHAIYGWIENDDGTIPSSDCLLIRAYYGGTPDTLKYPEQEEAGTEYDDVNGIWLVETSYFSTVPDHGDIISIYFVNTCLGQDGYVSVVYDTTTPSQGVDTIGMAEMAIEDSKLPEDQSMRAYPNPFNAALTVESEGEIEIFDMMGNKIAIIRGNGTRVWTGTDDNGNKLSSGIYLLRNAKEDKTVKRVFMIR